MAKYTTVKFRCTNCNAEDHYKLAEGENCPIVMNCLSCGNGRDIPDAMEAFRRRKGMFPVHEEEGQLAAAVN